MASNQKRLVKRFLEPGNRQYVFGVFEATGHGSRQLTAVIDGTREDAVAFMKAPLTERGHSRKGFKKQ